ncbi:hypothetical protein M0802_012729 [Mischocyttarus mexicanus]|nr:hypothetical protein M0802_012729 [Mischocyttarus mexicanus]
MECPPKEESITQGAATPLPRSNHEESEIDSTNRHLSVCEFSIKSERDRVGRLLVNLCAIGLCLAQRSL